MPLTPKCEIHGVPLVCWCPKCVGSKTSKAKAKSSRENGRKGGRPKLRDSEVSPATLYRRKLQKRKQRQRRET